ncbi:MAG TPA: hypothetical protein VFL17_13500 [Anaerolineae bacterium]|nr:hypothetical protein [Anaerolineae bacterium]
MKIQDGKLRLQIVGVTLVVLFLVECAAPPAGETPTRPADTPATSDATATLPPADTPTGPPTPVVIVVTAIPRPTATPVPPTVILANSDTSIWKTYANTRYGYSFKYPLTWDFTDYHDLRPSDAELSVSREIAVAGGGLHFRVVVNGYPLEEHRQLCDELTQCVRMYNESLNSDPEYEIRDQSPVIVGGEMGMRQTVERRVHGWAHFQTFIIKDDDFYVLTLTAPLEEYPEGLRLYNDLLSTLEFER